MSKRRNQRSQGSSRGAEQNWQRRYEHACRLAEQGGYPQARRAYQLLEQNAPDEPRKALVRNDLATLLAVEGDLDAARNSFQAALILDPQCETARANLEVLQEAKAVSVADPPRPDNWITAAEPGSSAPIKVAILSFLFNWPSTGGGIVHTVELAQFLGRAGYEVQHFYVVYGPWGVGQVQGTLPIPSKALEFDESTWGLDQIQVRFRREVERFAPDYVIITDSWNIKPLLAEAVSAYPYILRFQAMECICPLNNVRLLPEGGGRFSQCNRHQLATPDICAECVQKRGHFSGSLHQAERALSGVGSRQYYERLLRAFTGAEVVLVVNPLQEAMLSPYTNRVRVVTAGMDPARFAWVSTNPAQGRDPKKPLTLFFAGLVEERMKGFDVLLEACSRLWQKRQDFELVATADPPGQVNACTRFVGWQTQEDLPGQLRAADLLVMPTIAQEALGRTAVEAMAAGIPVIASRIGGLPFTVAEGSTGLLFHPGDVDDLAAKIETLLDNPDLRRRMGLAGRQRFEEHYSWDVIIERHYRPLLCRKRNAVLAS